MHLKLKRLRCLLLLILQQLQLQQIQGTQVKEANRANIIKNLTNNLHQTPNSLKVLNPKQTKNLIYLPNYV